MVKFRMMFLSYFKGKYCATVILKMGGSREEWTGGQDHHPCNTGSDPLKITKLPIHHSMLGHHRHASETPRANDGPLIVICGSFLPSLTKQKVGPPLRKHS